MAHHDIQDDEHARRRLGCVVLLRDRRGRVALVEPRYKPGHILPGGAAHKGESIADAAARELKEELGIDRDIRYFVALDQVPANAETGACEGLNVVCIADRLTDEEARTLIIPETAEAELAAVRLVEPADLSQYCLPAQHWRIRQAIAADEHGTSLPLLALGEPVG